MSAKNSYYLGIFWFILSIFCSLTNDVLSKYANNALHPFQVAFLRFLFATIVLIPVILYNGIGSIRSSSIKIHILRGTLLFLGIVSWTYGLKYVQIPTATVISFSIPVFTLILAVFFLKENIIWQRWVATAVGLLGVIVTLYPELSEFNLYGFVFLGATILFASLDIINKIFVVKETMISMMFYSSLTTCFLAFIPAMYYWQPIDISTLLLLSIFGASANLILFFILKAFSLVDATAIAPYRYLELPLSGAASYILFGDVPPITTLYGALIIIPATLFIAYSESSRKN